MSPAIRETAIRLRLFFALLPDAPARAALTRIAAEIAGLGQGRATRDAGLHLTLAFLGEIEADRVDAAITAGRHAAARTPAFPLSLERIGGTAYGIAWLAPASLPTPLALLHETLDQALRDAGFVLQQRMFRPHVTLARDCIRAANRGRIVPVSWQAVRLSLVASTLAPGGSQYREIEGWPLSGQSTGTV